MIHAATQAIRDEHAALRAMLQSLRMLVARGPAEHPGQYFDVMRAMLFYIDEFPERLHHPRESQLLFPALARATPALAEVVGRLDADHASGEQRVHELQHRLLAWELVGDTRRAAFEQAARQYVDFYLEHMRVEEVELLPAAERLLGPADWAALDAAFTTGRDPLAGGVREACYDRLRVAVLKSADLHRRVEGWCYGIVVDANSAACPNVRFSRVYSPVV